MVSRLWKILTTPARWLWCVTMHKWTRYDAVRYGCNGAHDVECERVCYCLTCGRDCPDWLQP